MLGVWSQFDIQLWLVFFFETYFFGGLRGLVLHISYDGWFKSTGNFPKTWATKQSWFGRDFLFRSSISTREKDKRRTRCRQDHVYLTTVSCHMELVMMVILPWKIIKWLNWIEKIRFPLINGPYILQNLPKVARTIKNNQLKAIFGWFQHRTILVFWKFLGLGHDFVGFVFSGTLSFHSPKKRSIPVFWPWSFQGCSTSFLEEVTSVCGKN